MKGASIDYSLERAGWGSYQKKVFWLCCHSWWLIMMNSNSFAVIPNLSSIEKSLLASSYSLGSLLGCYVSGLLSDKRGRSYVFKRSQWFSFLGTTALVFSQWYVMTLICAFFIGISCGCDMVVTNTLAYEFFPPSKRSKVTLITAAWSMGTATVYIIALLLSLSEFTLVQHWRVVSVFIWLNTVLSLLARFELLETPMFLYYSKQVYAYNQVMYSITQEFTESMTTPMMDDIDESAEASLFDNRYLKRTLLTTVVFFLSIYAYSSLLMFMPMFMPVSSEVQLFAILILQQFFGVPGKIMAAKLVDSRLGRVYTSCLFFALASLCLVPFMFTDHLAIIFVPSLVYYFAVECAFSSLYTHSNELFESDVRSTAAGLLNSSARIGNALGPAVAGAIYDSLGIEVAMLQIAGSFAIIAGLCVMLKETRPKYHYY